MSFAKKYIIGWGLGPMAAVYGLISLLVGRAFLPGLHGDNITLGGRGGAVLSLAYISGGVFLFLRLVIDKRQKSNAWQNILLYMVQNILLIVFIASLIYVLLRVDTVQ